MYVKILERFGRHRTFAIITSSRIEELPNYLRGRFQGQHTRADWLRLISGHTQDVHVWPVRF